MSDILRAPTKKDLPTAEYIRSILSYDPETGVLRWRTYRSGGKTSLLAGSSTSEGYMAVEINSKAYKNHRLAWLITHGYWPVEIDHINGNRKDNRLCNLRECSRSGNRQNLKSAHSNNASGLLGVSKRPYGYQARLTLNGKTLTLGCFKTADEAHTAYLDAKRGLHPGGTL